jgi:hypothetical protein
MAGKPGGKRPLGRSRRRRKDKIKNKKKGWEDVYWTCTSQEGQKIQAFMKTVINMHHPWNVGIFFQLRNQ